MMDMQIANFAPNKLLINFALGLNFHVDVWLDTATGN